MRTHSHIGYTNQPQVRIAVNIGKALLKGGEDLIASSEILATTGLASLAVGGAATLLGQPEIGVPFVAAGLVMEAGAGVLLTGGLAAQGLGGVILAAGGNSQPLQATVGRVVQEKFDRATRIPSGFPSPYAPAIERDLRNMEAGENPCP